MNELIDFEKVVLEAFKYQMNLRFPVDGPINTAVDIDWSELNSDMRCAVLKLRANVLGERLQVQTVQYPSDWLEAFKERWYPSWLKKRYPVKYKTVTMEARALYPRISLPREQHYVHILKHEHIPFEKSAHSNLS